MKTLAAQMGRFLVTGGVNTVFGYVIYALGAGVLDFAYAPALLLSYAIGIPFSYMTFRAFVFTGGDRSFATFARFLPTYGVLLVFNLVALHAAVDILGWHKLIAQAVIVPVCAAISFVCNRLFVFREAA